MYAASLNKSIQLSNIAILDIMSNPNIDWDLAKINSAYYFDTSHAR